MKKIMMVAALMVMTIAAKAQNAVGQITLKPMVGLSLTNITNENENNLKGGAIAGVEAEYGVSNMIGISAGVLYSMQGCNYSDRTVSINGVSTGIKDESTNLEYINIPILANFYVAKGFALKVGVQPGFLVSSKYKKTQYATAGSLSEESNTDADMKDYCNSFDFSIPLGASYTFGDSWTIDARYNFGLTKIYKEKYTTESCKNSVFMVTVGYKFAL